MNSDEARVITFKSLYDSLLYKALPFLRVPTPSGIVKTEQNTEQNTEHHY